MESLKLLGRYLFIIAIWFIIFGAIVVIMHGIAVVWPEKKKIHDEIEKVCLNSKEIPGMKMAQQEVADGAIMVMCDNGKERWIKVVK